MAFSTEGWRKIVVDDQIYYWQTTRSPDLFHVRPEREPNRLLWVTSSQCGNDVATVFRRGVTPRIVRDAIVVAIDHAWLAERPSMRLALFNNPIRYVCRRPIWLTSTVAQLAASIFAESAFDQMPILADALQDAGCDNADILDHCRSEKRTQAVGLG